MQTSDWQANVTLPGSEDCFGINVMSRKEERISASDPVCVSKKQHSVWLSSEAYNMLRKDIQTNCQYQQCKQVTGAFDGLFLSIDKALQQIPGN